VNATHYAIIDAHLVGEGGQILSAPSIGERILDGLAKVNFAAVGGAIFWGAITVVGGVLTVTFFQMGGALGISLGIVYGMLSLFGLRIALTNLILSFIPLNYR
jgi:TRAP-type C4-dicarboxylate transport system permease small subunit